MTIRETPYYVYNNQPLSELADLVLSQAPTVDEANINSSDQVNQRLSKAGFITAQTDLGQNCFRELWKFVVDANHQANWNFDLHGCEPFQYTKYESNDRYDWHIDTIFGQEDVRKISFSLLLDDKFSGGELQFEIGSPDSKERIITIELKKGDIVLFPSNTWHRVKPVTEGVRYSLVGWCRGPQFA